LITPFKDDLSVDYAGLAEMVDYCIEEMECDGLVPCGTTGESTTLSHEEHVDVIQAVVKQTRKRVPVIASAGSNSTSEAVHLTKLAEQVGADATLQVGPYYNKPTQEGLFNHFAAVAAASKLPLVIYNIPGRTSRNIEPQTIARLWREVPNVIGLKDCSNDLHQMMTIYRSTDPDTFKIYCGEDIMTLSLLCLGGAGAIAAVAHIVGKEVKAMCNAVWEGRLPEARELHYRTIDIVDALFVEPNPTPVKQALEWLGLPAGPLRPPLERMSPAGQAVLQAAMRAGGWLA
jgi:4-hydroxy-tetrahydrodipicolinate synthase